MKHFNGHLPCAIDVETTGLLAAKHDMWELAIVPLDTQFKPRRDILPFHAILKPGRCWIQDGVLTGEFDSVAVRMNEEGIMKALTTGIDADEVTDHFEAWFERLNLAENKRITPLGQNYAFDRSFVVELLGIKSYEHFFNYHYRDTMHTALFLNDLAGYNGNAIPFPKVSLKYLCSQLKVTNDKAHSAMSDAICEAEVYRRLLGNAS